MLSGRIKHHTNGFLGIEWHTETAAATSVITLVADKESGTSEAWCLFVDEEDSNSTRVLGTEALRMLSYVVVRVVVCIESTPSGSGAD